MKIRSKTISYATMKKRVDEEKEKDLQNSIQKLETEINLTEDEKMKLEHNKLDLVALRKKNKWREFFFVRERDGLRKARK